MNHRENTLKAYRFQIPEWIPVTVEIPLQDWVEYDPEEIADILENHPILFPDFSRDNIDPNRIVFPPQYTKGRPYTDGWGCIWQTNYNGMHGAVIIHPLANWASFETFQVPDPDHSDGFVSIDWDELRHITKKNREDQKLIFLSLPHGHTFLRLQDLRGFENLIYDMADEPPNLLKLITMLESFNLELVKRYLELEPDIFGIPEDLGMQNTPLISPQMFRKYIKPSYCKITDPFKKKRILIHHHCDGYILDLIEDLIEADVDIINLQDRVNGIDNIQKQLKGRIAIDLDIDRQHVSAHGSRQDIDDLIHEAVSKLGSREGGLSMIFHAWPPMPIVNIRAVCGALEKYCFYYC